MIKMGIMGAGNIATYMVRTVEKMEGVVCHSIGAREERRAREFADQYGIDHAYGSYEALLEDKEVDIIYIATPHSHHYEHIKMCLNHGKHVLCEKAFTVNEEQAAEVFALAKEKKLLLTEAIWTRYMPMRETLNQLITGGIIGTPYLLTANLGYIISGKERILRPELAGGALLDVGVYTLNFASMVFGNEIRSITGTAVLMDTGVDAQNSVTLVYEDGRMAVLTSSAMGLSDRRGVIYGDNGFIEVDNINNCEGIRVYDKSRKLIESFEPPRQISGYEYEVEACMEAINAGALECPQMPHEETLRMMRWMDELRRQWGIVYPME